MRTVMARQPNASPERVLIVAEGLLAGVLVDRLLPERGLEGVAVEMATAITAREASSVILYQEHWTGEVARTVRRLDDRNYAVYLICRDAGNPDLNLAMLEAGAVEASVDREPMLRVMVCKLSRRLARQPLRWRVGALVVDVVEQWARHGGWRVRLTGSEAQLLRHLYVASRAGKSLFASQLASKLAKTEQGVYNHIRDLRGKLEHDLHHPRVLELDSENGYHLKLDQSERPSLASHEIVRN